MRRLLLLLLLSMPTWARPIGPITSVTRLPTGLLGQCQDGSQLQVTALAPDVIRVRTSFGKPLETPESRWAVVDPGWPAPQIEVTDSSLKTSELSVSLTQGRVEIRDRSGRNWLSDQQPMTWEPNGSFKVYKDFGQDEHFYGLGEKASPLDHRRGRFSMWNSDTPGYREGTDPIYQSIPFYLGLRDGRAYGLFLDNSYRTTFEFGYESQEFSTFGAQGGEANYYFFAGPEMQKVVRRYTELTGRPPLWPRWALGHQASRWSYYPERVVEEVVREYRKRAIPLDSINLDIHYMDGYRVFTWDHERFPDFKAMIERLGRLGVRVITIIDPGVKYDPAYNVCKEGLERGFFQKKTDGQLWVPKVWPGDALMVDYTLPEARQWWGELHKVLLDAGVAGIWNDMNEPADFVEPNAANPTVVMDDEGRHSLHPRMRNLFALLEARSTYEGLRRLQPGRRPFLVTRAAYAGIQRYSTMWNGDTRATWENLAMSLPMFANLGLSGESFVGGDVGGFVGRGNGELLVRSYQMATLLPFCRNHKEISGYDQEPWRFGKPYEDAIREALRQRYRLLPYLYTQIELAHRTGLPAWRPLVLNYQDDETTWNLDDEVMIGTDLLSAPVLKEGATSRQVYFPAGTWIDYWSGQRMSGRQMVRVAAPLSRLPLYVRAGSIIPTGPETDRVHEGAADPLELTVYPDERGRARGEVFEDDGISTKADYRRTRFRLEGRSLSWDGEGTFPVAGRRLVFHLPGGKRLEVKDDAGAHQLSF